MGTPDNWRKSSYSGPGDGDSCVEIANDHTQVAIRDSKDRAYASLAFPPNAFVTFVQALKGTLSNWRKSSYSGAGDGNSCVEIAHDHTQVAIRDSKNPTHATLIFTPFPQALARPHSPTPDTVHRAS